MSLGQAILQVWAQSTGHRMPEDCVSMHQDHDCICPRAAERPELWHVLKVGFNQSEHLSLHASIALMF